MRLSVRVEGGCGKKMTTYDDDHKVIQNRERSMFSVHGIRLVVYMYMYVSRLEHTS